MDLTQQNLERHGWLFSPSLSVMVREHELGDNTWDFELDSYRNVGTADKPVYEPSQEWFDAADTVVELIAQNPELSRRQDWVSGDKVKML